MANVLTVAFLPNFSLPIVFTCVVRQIFPYQIFPVYGIAIATIYLVSISFVHDTDVNYDHVLYYFCIWDVAKTCAATAFHFLYLIPWSWHIFLCHFVLIVHPAMKPIRILSYRSR